MKSVTIEHPKTAHKSFKTIREAENVSQVGDAGKQKDEKILDEKNVKINK